MPRMPIPAKSPTTIPAMVDGFRPFCGLLGVPLGFSVVFVSGFVSMLWGMAAMAGDDDDVEVVELGGFDSVEGTEQRTFRGFPQRSEFPESDSVFWLSKARDCGIGPVRLLKERSTVEFAGIFSANDGGIEPEILL